MTRRELALLQTARSTNACLDRYQDLWNDLPGFAPQREMIRRKVAELEELAGGEGVERSDVARQRQVSIQALAEEAWIVAGQVQAWAAAKGDRELADAVRTTRDELVWLQLGLAERALEIHRRAVESLRKGGGEEFGLSLARLDSLAERIQAVKILRVPPVRREPGAVARDGVLAGGLNQLMDLICEVADPLMRRFRLESPEFYDAYQVARRIVDPETGTLLTCEDELASLDEDIPAFSGEGDGGARVRADWRTMAPASGARRKQGAAALSS